MIRSIIEEIITAAVIFMIVMTLAAFSGCIFDPPTRDMLAIQHAAPAGRISRDDLVELLRSQLPGDINITATGLTAAAYRLPSSTDVWRVISRRHDGGPWIREHTDTYDCRNFAAVFQTRLRREGWPCGIVHIRRGVVRSGLFKWTIHASFVDHAQNIIVCRDGIWVVEPQDNKFTRLSELDPMTTRIDM